MLLQTVEQFVGLYDTYVDRCENTKTEVLCNVWRDGIDGEETYVPVSEHDSLDLGFSPYYRGKKLITKTREATFDGFMEYLRGMK